MEVFVLSFIFIVVMVAAMSIGVIFANKPIKGSCGGMSALGIDTACDICGGNPKICEEEKAKRETGKAADSLSYDATKR